MNLKNGSWWDKEKIERFLSDLLLNGVDSYPANPPQGNGEAKKGSSGLG
jgi:hypothetical protein